MPADDPETMQAHKVYVSNLSFDVDEVALAEAFRDGVGQDSVVTTEVIRNREGQSKGFGFVVLSDNEAMQQAIDKMHRTPLMGRDISVTRAIPKDQMAPRSSLDRRPPPMGRPSSGDFGGYNSYGRLSTGGYMPPAAVAPMRGPPPFRGGGARGGFRVVVSGLPAHFGWRELKDFLRTGSQNVTYADVKRPGTGTGEWATAHERAMAIRALHGVAVSGCTVRVREDDDDLEPMVPPVAGGMMPPPLAPMGRMSAYDERPMYGGGYSRGMPPRGMYAARDPYYDDMRAPYAPRPGPMRGAGAYGMPMSSRDMAMAHDMPMRGSRGGYSSRMPVEAPMSSPYYPASGSSRYADRAPMYDRGSSREPPARLSSYASRPSSAAVPSRVGPSRYAPY